MQREMAGDAHLLDGPAEESDSTDDGEGVVRFTGKPVFAEDRKCVVVVCDLTPGQLPSATASAPRRQRYSASSPSYCTIILHPTVVVVLCHSM